MSDIHIERPTSLSPADVRRKFEEEVLPLPEFRMFVSRHEVKGDVVTFGGSAGVGGRVEALPGKIVLDLDLSGMAAMMKPMIQSKLEELLARLFPS
jgi:putative polyhydroxyalkanoate system protein